MAAGPPTSALLTSRFLIIFVARILSELWRALKMSNTVLPCVRDGGIDGDRVRIDANFLPVSLLTIAAISVIRRSWAVIAQLRRFQSYFVIKTMAVFVSRNRDCDRSEYRILFAI